MEKGKLGLLALAALGLAALTMATITFTNVSYWVINATLPPAMKYPGLDTQTANGQFAKVSYYYSNGVNITRISIIGFTGDPTNYSNLLLICNKYYQGNIQVTLQAVGTVGSTGLESYVDDFRVYNSANPQQYVEFKGTSVVQSTANLGTIGYGQCITLGAYIDVDPTLPATYANGNTVLATYQINIVMSPQ
ncbi:hypothetical protein [Thermoproteus tenax]|nr:hypothetical protein [Thermoproteus tenax]